MKIVLATVITKKFIATLGRTVVECNMSGKPVSVWLNGDHEANGALMINLTINEVGDTFKASKDSSRVHPADHADKKLVGKPIYLKGDIVKRLTESNEFKSWAGNNQPAQFAQAAAGFGLQLNVIMQSAA